jgi:hypothetical protein
MNEECLVSASHQDAENTSLVLVHTARRYRERVLSKASRSGRTGQLVFFLAAKCNDTWDLDMVEVVTRLL